MLRKRNFTLYIIPLFLCSFLTIHVIPQSPLSKNIWLIIHGTFAQHAVWHKPSGEFFKTLQRHAGPNTQIYNFRWSGINSDEARLQAGITCKNYVRTIINPHDKLHIVAHSHGGNVALVAVNQLTKEKSPLSIETLITLGTPVDIDHYKPDMERIKIIYNLFSYGDRVQPVLQIFKRTFPEHPHIYNIQIMCNGYCPTHSELHSTLIAQHLPTLKKLINYEKKPLLVHFFDKKNPIVTLDNNREKDLEIDRIFTQQILSCIAESRHGKKTWLSDKKYSFESRTLRLWNWWRINFK